MKSQTSHFEGERSLRHPAPLAEPAEAAIEPGPGALERWRVRRMERRQAHLVSDRNRSALAQCLRRTADRALEQDRARRRFEVLLRARAAAVRDDLLEIADLLEHTDNPDPACVANLYKLLRDGQGPLYNSEIHISKLRARLFYARRRLDPLAQASGGDTR